MFPVFFSWCTNNHESGHQFSFNGEQCEFQNTTSVVLTVICMLCDLVLHCWCFLDEVLSDLVSFVDIHIILQCFDQNSYKSHRNAKTWNNNDKIFLQKQNNQNFMGKKTEIITWKWKKKIKSCVSNRDIYHTKMFCPTPKSQWHGDEHGSNKQKSQSHFKNKKHLKNIQPTTPPILKRHSKNQSAIARAKTFSVRQVISKYDNVIWSNKKHDTHWVIFTRYFLVMQNIVDMSSMYHTKSIIKTRKMPSCQTTANLPKKSHVYDLHQH